VFLSQQNPRNVFPVWQLTALLLLFSAIAAAVSLNATMGFDRTIIMSLRAASNIARPAGPDWAIEAIRDLTSLGSVLFVFLFTAVVCGYWMFTGNHRAAVLLLGSALGALLLNDLLKQVFDRTRPDAILQSARVFSSGFPSGHAALSCATYFSAAILVPSATAAQQARIFLLWTAVLIVVAIGFSRIYLGLHYPTDVLAGWCVGGAWVLCWYWIFDRLRPNNSGA
jgi:undecaprenyl-diphosphatase